MCRPALVLAGELGWLAYTLNEKPSGGARNALLLLLLEVLLAASSSQLLEICLGSNFGSWRAVLVNSHRALLVASQALAAVVLVCVSHLYEMSKNYY